MVRYRAPRAVPKSLPNYQKVIRHLSSCDGWWANKAIVKRSLGMTEPQLQRAIRMANRRATGLKISVQGKVGALPERVVMGRGPVISTSSQQQQQYIVHRKLITPNISVGPYR